jgi:hypothetical protein
MISPSLCYYGSWKLGDKLGDRSSSPLNIVHIKLIAWSNASERPFVLIVISKICLAWEIARKQLMLGQNLDGLSLYFW